MLQGFHKSGEAELLAVMVWNREEYSMAGVDAVNRFYGHPDIPIGLRACPSHSLDWNYSRPIAEVHSHKRTNEDALAAVDLYREIVAQNKDGSITLVTVGPLGTYREKVTGRYNEVDRYGNNRWMDGAPTNQSYMRLLKDADEMARYIEALMLFDLEDRP